MLPASCRKLTIAAGETPAARLENMLDKILFWVVLVWMIGMLVMTFLAVREVWKDASKPQSDAEGSDSPPPGDDPPRDKASTPTE